MRLLEPRTYRRDGWPNRRLPPPWAAQIVIPDAAPPTVHFRTDLQGGGVLDDHHRPGRLLALFPALSRRHHRARHPARRLRRAGPVHGADAGGPGHADHARRRDDLHLRQAERGQRADGRARLRHEPDEPAGAVDRRRRAGSDDQLCHGALCHPPVDRAVSRHPGHGSAHTRRHAAARPDVQHRQPRPDHLLRHPRGGWVAAQHPDP